MTDLPPLAKQCPTCGSRHVAYHYSPEPPPTFKHDSGGEFWKAQEPYFWCINCERGWRDRESGPRPIGELRASWATAMAARNRIAKVLREKIGNTPEARLLMEAIQKELGASVAEGACERYGWADLPLPTCLRTPAVHCNSCGFPLLKKDLGKPCPSCGVEPIRLAIPKRGEQP